MSAAELARRLDVPTNRVTEILNGRRAITGSENQNRTWFRSTSQSVHRRLKSSNT
jgi:hypothetical protein